MSSQNKFDKEMEKLYGIAEKVDDTTFIVRKEVPKNKLWFEKGHLYIVRIDSSDVSTNLLITTATNWNSGRYMKSNYLKCECVGELGNMIKLNGRGYEPNTDTDTDDVYLNYWIDKSVIEVIKEI